MVGIIITLSVAIPVSAVVTGYFTLKAYEMGIKHNYQLRNNEKPSESKSIIETVSEAVADVSGDKKMVESYEIFKEYTGM